MSDNKNLPENSAKNNQENSVHENDANTTGHEWDGIREYNIGAPRWWLIVWIICIIWGVGYWFFYPAIPNAHGSNQGALKWSKYSQLEESQQEITEKKAVHLEKISRLSFQEIQQDQQLMEFALNGGKSAFRENCSACHGQGAQGAKGYPNLNDDDWLWGGKIEDIYQTLLYGIRSGHDKARANQMPSFGLDKVLKKDEINSTIEYVLSLSSKTQQTSNAINLGETIFKNNCVACHGVDAKGNQKLGAPNLTDAIWLYGNNKEDLYQTIYFARAGVMPFWQNRLDDNTIKQLALYVHSLGGGIK
jgi:cytochrome c oxidase cbb3-type subunit 3